MELKDYLFVIKKRWVWILATFSFFIALYFFILTSEQRKYETVSRVMIQVRPIEQELLIQAPRAYFTTEAREKTLSRSELKEFASKLVLVDQLEYNMSGKSLIERIFLEKEPSTVKKDEDRSKELNSKSIEDLYINYLNKKQIGKDDIKNIRAEIDSSIIVSMPDHRTLIIEIKSIGYDKQRTRYLADAYAGASILYSESYEKSIYDRAQGDLENRQKLFVKQIEEKMQTIENKPIEELRRNRNDLLDSKKSLMEQINELDKRIWEISMNKVEFEEREKILQLEKHLEGAKYPGIIEFDAETQKLLTIDMEIRRLQSEISEQLYKKQPIHPDIKALNVKLERLIIERDALTKLLLDNKSINTKIDKRLNQIKEEYLYREKNKLDQKVDDTEKQIASIEPILKIIDDLTQSEKSISENIQKLESSKKLIRGFVLPYERASEPIVRKKSVEGMLPLWILIGLICSLAIGFLSEYVETAIITEYDVRKHLNLPVIGIVPKLKHEKALLENMQESWKSTSEIYNTISTILKPVLTEGKFKTITVCSAKPKEGKSFFVVNLGIALLQKGAKVLLIDTDLRKPRLHNIFNLDNTSGLTTLVSDNLQALSSEEFDNLKKLCIKNFSIKDLGDSVSVLTSGPLSDNPPKLLESENMKLLLKKLCDGFDYIIIDTPPICTVGDALILAEKTDSTVLVVGSGLVERREATWAKHLLSRVQAKILGVILNKATYRNIEYYYYYYYYSPEKSKKHIRHQI